MDEQNNLAEPFEAHRAHLRGVAYRMLGSLAEAEDAVQEAWLRLSRADTSDVQNLRGWLTTVVARVCLDMLRSRKSRREESLSTQVREPIAKTGSGADPEHEALLADSVGLALLVVLDTLTPAERLAFVLHDLFGFPFEEIGPIVGRSPTAARQLASRARRRVRAPGRIPATDLNEQRELVKAFLAALRRGDVEALVQLLDPDVVVTADAAAGVTGATEIRGAEAWARQAVVNARGARFAQPALVDGAVGIVVAPRGRLFRVLNLTIGNGRIARIEVIADRERLNQLDLAVIE